MTIHTDYELYDKCLRVVKVYNERQIKIATRYLFLALEVCHSPHITRLIEALMIGLAIKHTIYMLGGDTT